MSKLNKREWERKQRSKQYSNNLAAKYMNKVTRPSTHTNESKNDYKRVKLRPTDYEDYADE